MHRLTHIRNRVFGDVDGKLMEETVMLHKTATSKDVKSFIAIQKEAKKKKAIQRKERIEKEKKEEDALVEANRQKLLKRFAILPREEIAEIYEECDRDYDRTVNELLILVAMVESQQEQESGEEPETEKTEEHPPHSGKDKHHGHHHEQDEDPKGMNPCVPASEADLSLCTM